MVNICSNVMWLIRLDFPLGVSEEEKKNEQGHDQKSGSVTVNEIGLQKEAVRRFCK